jgi:hypothetical protein
MRSAFFTADPRNFAFAFVFTVVGSLTVVAGLNYFINPLNYYQTDRFPPLVQTTREEKVAHLLAMKQPPDGLILGSSRVLKFEPAYLSEQTGRSFYNAGVTHAHAEDHVAMLRFYRENFAQWPAVIIIGVDEFAFSASEPVDRDLVATPQLADQLTDFISINDRLQPLRSLVEWQQTKLSLRSIKQHALSHHSLTKVESIQPDGRIVYHQREQEIADGAYDYQSAVDYNIQEYAQIVSRYHAVCPQRVQVLADTLLQCADSGSEIVLFFTPLHTTLHQHLAVEPNYERRMAELGHAIGQIAISTKSSVHDFTDPKTFNGDLREFVDGIHPLEINTRKMIDAMLRADSGGNKLAIQ